VPSSKILVAEDFEHFRRFVCSVLQQRVEFQVSEASDGLEAVQKAEELQPDVILLDIGLPGPNGLEVAKRIRKVAPATRILFLSMESDPDVVKEALTRGEGYIHKPRSQSDLLPAIEAVLRGERFVSRDLGHGRTEGSHQQHEILVCSEDTILLDGLTRFVADALSGGNAAILQATESHRDSILERLRHEGVDIDAATRRGTYISSDASAPRDPASVLAAVRSLKEAAEKAGNKNARVALCGERAAYFWARGEIDAAFCLERFFNELTKTYDVDILCVYLRTQGQGEDSTFKRICRDHTTVRSW